MPVCSVGSRGARATFRAQISASPGITCGAGSIRVPWVTTTIFFSAISAPTSTLRPTALRIELDRVLFRRAIYMKDRKSSFKMDDYECASSAYRHLALAAACGVVAVLCAAVVHNKRAYVGG
jgi:hypothetical protein